MKNTSLFVTVVVAVLLVAGAAPLLANSIVASGGTGSSAQSSYPVGSNGWEVYDSGGAGGYQDVYYDPTAGPWQKTLGGIQGGAINGGIYQLVEMLHVGGGPNGTAPGWTDYHESVLTAGWTWSPNGPQGQQWGFASPTYNGNWTYVVPVGNTQVDWSFNPAMPVCTNFTLTKWLTFNANALGADPNVPVVVTEYPTIPEPGTMALLGLGLASLIARRKRK